MLVGTLKKGARPHGFRLGRSWHPFGVRTTHLAYRRSSLCSDLRLLSNNPAGCKDVNFVSCEGQTPCSSEPSMLLP
jgi:hypothetical protein